MSALWQPTWQATHAYATYAVVTPTTFGGYTWRCTTPGTSGGVEPVWPDPTLGTTTIVDGTVTWSVGTGFRQELISGLIALIDAFAQANPTIIRSQRSERPLSFANVPLPCFIVGDMNESITTGQGLRTRTFTGFSAMLVDAAGSLDEAGRRSDFAADVLADLYTGGIHLASGRSIFYHVGTNDTEVPNGEGVLPALEFLFSETFVTEGRL